MARQRTMAPGYYRNEELAACSPLARLLFPGLWCWADRRGRLEDRPRRLRAEILPYDNADGEALIAELAAHGFLKRYEVNGVRVIQIVNFERYQNPHPNETESVLPDEAGNTPPPLTPKVNQGRTKGEPKDNSGTGEGEPREGTSPASLLASRPSQPSCSLASKPARSARGPRARAGGATMGPLGVLVVASVAAGLGHGLLPLATQAEADDFEARVVALGTEEAVAYLAGTCRKRELEPSAVKLLLLWLEDLGPLPVAVGGAR